MNHGTNALGDLLRGARQRLGVSLRDVEDATGVSNAYRSQLESGKIKRPSPALLKRLCDYLKLSYAELLEFFAKDRKREPYRLMLIKQLVHISSKTFLNSSTKLSSNPAYKVLA